MAPRNASEAAKTAAAEGARQDAAGALQTPTPTPAKPATAQATADGASPSKAVNSEHNAGSPAMKAAKCEVQKILKCTSWQVLGTLKDSLIDFFCGVEGQVSDSRSPAPAAYPA